MFSRLFHLETKTSLPPPTTPPGLAGRLTPPNQCPLAECFWHQRHRNPNCFGGWKLPQVPSFTRSQWRLPHGTTRPISIYSWATLRIGWTLQLEGWINLYDAGGRVLKIASFEGPMILRVETSSFMETLDENSVHRIMKTSCKYQGSFFPVTWSDCTPFHSNVHAVLGHPTVRSACAPTRCSAASASWIVDFWWFLLEIAS